MSKADLNPDIDVKISGTDLQSNRTDSSPGQDDGSMKPFEYGTILNGKDFPWDIVFMEGREDLQDVQKEVIALLNSNQPGLLLLGINEGGMVKGISMTRKGRDIFRQAWDDTLSGLIPDCTFCPRIKPPQLIPVLHHPLDSKKNEPGASSFVVGIEITSPQSKNNSQVAHPNVERTWFKMASSHRCYFRQNGKTVEVSSQNMCEK